MWAARHQAVHPLALFQVRSSPCTRVQNPAVAVAPQKCKYLLAPRYRGKRQVLLASQPSSPSPAEDPTTDALLDLITNPSLDNQAQVDQVLQSISTDPELLKELQGVREAAKRVAELKAERAALEDLDAPVSAATTAPVQQQRGSQEAGAEADAEVVRAKAAVEAAQAEVEAARREILQAQEGGAQKWSSGDIDEDAEKIESGKAAVISALVGTFATLPFTLSSSEEILVLIAAVGTAFLSCVLFGVTYRYAVRSDLGNTQLKGGVVGAFGLVSGVAQGNTILSIQGVSVESVLQGALLAGESVITFAFAAAALELAFKSQNLKPFGTAAKN